MYPNQTCMAWVGMSDNCIKFSGATIPYIYKSKAKQNEQIPLKLRLLQIAQRNHLLCQRIQIQYHYMICSRNKSTCQPLEGLKQHCSKSCTYLVPPMQAGMQGNNYLWRNADMCRYSNNPTLFMHPFAKSQIRVTTKLSNDGQFCASISNVPRLCFQQPRLSFTSKCPLFRPMTLQYPMFTQVIV